MEITSVGGGLVNGMREDDFFRGYSMPRNREIMRVFKDIELVEHLGSGMLRIMKHYDRSNFIITPNFMRVVLPFSTRAELGDVVNDEINDELNDEIKLSKTEKSVYDIIKDNPVATMNDIANIIGKSKKTVERAIYKLMDMNIVARIGAKKDGHWQIQK